MTRFNGRRRSGFTLIELMVVIAIIAFLAGITMLIVPGALDKDRAATAATQLTSAMQISRARAVRDGLPRGVRLVFNPNNPAGQYTEYQYIESPPPFVPNPGGPIGVAPYASNAAPFVQFNYTTNNTGVVTARSCTIVGLINPDHTSQVTVGSVLSLPTLGTYHRITGISGASPMTVTLDQYPDGPLGGQLHWQTYHFGFYGIPRPLLGEEVYQLPQRTCVDLNFSQPGNAGTDYDILFGPGGQLMNVFAGPNTGAAGQVFLVLRDPNKPAPPNFQQMGDVTVVVVKGKSGAVGAAPLNWDPTNYYLFAQQAVSGQ